MQNRANRKMKLSQVCVCANHPALAARSRNKSIPLPAASTCNSPPRATKDSAMASIHGQLLGAPNSHLTPPPLFATVVVSLCPFQLLRAFSQTCTGTWGGYSKDDSDDDDGLSHCRSSVGVYKLNEVAATDEHTSNYNGQKDDNLSNFGEQCP